MSHDLCRINRVAELLCNKLSNCLNLLDAIAKLMYEVQRSFVGGNAFLLGIKVVVTAWRINIVNVKSGIQVQKEVSDSYHSSEDSEYK